MAEPAALTGPEVEQLVRRVYLDLFDTHAPVDEFLMCLADEELEMRFPEATIRGHAEFRQWYDGIVHTYFDEVHTIKELEISTDGDRAEVKVLVNWQARTWTPPAPKSEGLVYDAGQTWEVRRSADTGSPVIVRYVVDTFAPATASG
jgi:hypothetical protein